MAQRQLSRTLPKNFTFPSLSADEPKTPERPSATIDVPPPPRHSISSCRLPRVRVRSGTDVCARMDLDIFRFQGNQDVALPSIEVNNQSIAPDASFSDAPSSDDRFLAPPRQRMVFKTPPAQIARTEHDGGDTESQWPSWDQTPAAYNIPRPDSACSNHSDSSIESIETFASRPSVGGSCTSAESDFDSYFPLEFPKEPEMSSPTLPKKHKVMRSQTKDKSWSREMDNHLWNTYQMYLQDPTMTPFKMTPGSIPPLGVTSRVSRRAKKTWEKNHRIVESYSMHSNNRSGSSTPKAVNGATQNVWPKSDAKTRRRLKLLCRRKFCIMPHYQRMMQSRSPEPAADMLGANTESHIRDFADNSTAAYGTRDLGVSLISTYDPTPLALLAEAPLPEEPNTEWFNNPVQTPSTEHMPPPVNQHLNVHPAHNIPRLGSPFVYNTWGPGGSGRQVQDLPPPARTMHVPGRRARRNTHLVERTPRDSDDVFSSDVFGDKEPSDAEVQNRLEHYMRDNKLQSMGHGRVRVRNRGATTSGAVGPRDVDQLFSPPSSLNSSQAEETTPVTKPPNPLLSLQQGENIKRLGSPFKLDGTFKRRDAPRRFVRHAPSLSDPFMTGGIPPYRGTVANPSPMEQEKPTGPSLQDPFEEGLSDAERIRRQILNMPFVRQ